MKGSIKINKSWKIKKALTQTISNSNSKILGTFENT